MDSYLDNKVLLRKKKADYEIDVFGGE